MYLKQTKTFFSLMVLMVSLMVSTVVTAETYTVQSGDTLSDLAVRFGTSVDSLVAMNHITNADRIDVGQVLEIAQANLELVPEQTVEEVQETQASTSDTQQAATTPAETPATTTLNTSESAAKEEIARRESGGSYTAQNGRYYGRYQLDLAYLNGDLSPENQERVADSYVASRYGSWTAALAHSNAYGWY